MRYVQNLIGVVLCLWACPAGAQDRGILTPLYVSYATLQGLDVATTTYALRHGAVEANPAMRGIAGQPATLTAVKAGTTVGVLLIVDKVIRPRSKTWATVAMIAANSITASVVLHNVSVISR